MNRARFDGMEWPVPDQDMHNLAWRLVHGDNDSIDELLAASVIEAYTELVTCSQEKRQKVVREINKHISGTELS